VEISRCLSATIVTSLDMAGMSVTVCRADDEMLRLWDARYGRSALRWGV
jgi:dihydroxyacetone kinase-like protein